MLVVVEIIYCQQRKMVCDGVGDFFGKRNKRSRLQPQTYEESRKMKYKQ
jgi:hypothetical protein